VWLVHRRTGARGRRLRALERALAREAQRKRDFDALRTSLDAIPEEEGALDEGTWNDLDLDRVFALADHTLSAPGEVLLYRWLRTPLQSLEALGTRAELLRAFEEHEDERVALQLELQRLGRSGSPRGLFGWAYGRLPEPNASIHLHTLLALLAAGSLGAGIALGGQAWLLTMVMFCVNMWTHYKTRRGIDQDLTSLQEVGRLVSCARRTSALSLPRLGDLVEPLGPLAAKLARVRRATLRLIPQPGTSFDFVSSAYEYVCIFFLIETRSYLRILRELQTDQASLRAAFVLVGEIDALQSAAVFRARLPRRCEPVLVDDRLTLRIQSGVHPLLADAVPNTLDLPGGSCFVTGSNMSGKSTFLRTIGLNAVLAQTLSVCSAEGYEASLFEIRTSIAHADDLSAGKSFYYAEAERLLGLIRAGDGPLPTLCVIDELLRGTNSVERLAAGEEILAYLAEKNALVIVATHDLELVDRLAGRYTGYHFSDRAQGGHLQFDYRLRPGTPKERNAIAILEQIGFPATLVERARARAGEGPPGRDGPIGRRDGLPGQQD